MRRNALLPLLKFPACIGMLLIGFLPAAAVAQDTTVVPIAARVRLHPAPDATVSAMRDGERVQLGFGRATVLNGVVAASPLDSMSLRTDSATYTFAISDVERLELLGGRHTSVRQSMLIGLAGGIVVGAIVGAVTPSCWSVDAYDDDTCGTAASIVGGAFGLGILGAVGGLVVGAIPRARYEEIRTPWAVGDQDISMRGNGMLAHRSFGTAAATACLLAIVACTSTEDGPTDTPPNEPPPGSQIVGGIEYSAETLVMESFPVQLRTIVTARNTSDHDIALHFPDPCVAMLYVYTDSARTGAPAWSQDRFIGCVAVIFDDTVSAGDTAQYAANTNGYEVLGDSLPDGRYWLSASLNPNGQRIEVPAGAVDLAIPRE